LENRPLSRSVLIIDDAPTLRKVLNFYLSQKGYKIREANNGKVGLDFIEREKFDIIILDMRMPVMSGAEVLAILKDKPDLNTPILILSADKEEETRARSLIMGAVYYMTKPFKPQEVVSQIEVILNS
jgi:two-component system, OmpR family, alkaline phosphatase synthesis response regulator PhoP